MILDRNTKLLEDIDSIELRISNLCNYSVEDMCNRVIVEGEWKVKIPFETKKVAKTMVENQTIHIEGKKYNIATIAVSPMGYYMEYTIPRSKSEHMADYMRILENGNTQMELVFKDGTSIKLKDCASGIVVAEDVIKFVFRDTFDTLIQMDEIQCVRIDGEEFE